MEFHVQLNAARPDLDRFDDAIRDVGPAAGFGVDAGGAVRRVAAAVQASELVALLAQAGYPVAAAQVRQLPSICCGGCSG